MRIDAHQHFWHYRPARDTWMTHAVLQRDYLPDDLAGELSAADIDATVAVQADSSPGETDFLLGLCDEYPWIAGVVGWVDLLGDDLAGALAPYRDDARVVGFRHIVQAEPAGFMDALAFAEALEAFAEADKAYDLLVYARQLPEAVRLLERLPPGLRIVLDHCGKPDVRGGGIERWREDIERVAAHEHVLVKLSGLVTEADLEHWRPDELQAYFKVVWDAFGAERILFGSDWPVCLQGISYAGWMSLAEEWLRPYGSAATARVLGENAAAFYRLNP